jgi:hypothetical protein
MFHSFELIKAKTLQSILYNTFTSHDTTNSRMIYSVGKRRGKKIYATPWSIIKADGLVYSDIYVLFFSSSFQPLPRYQESV